MRRRQSLAYSATTFGNTQMAYDPDKYFYNYSITVRKIIVSKQTSFSKLFYIDETNDQYNRINLYFLKYFTNLNSLGLRFTNYNFIYILLPENLPNNNIVIDGRCQSLNIGYFGNPENLKNLNITLLTQQPVEITYYILDSNKYNYYDFSVNYPYIQGTQQNITYIRPYTNYYNYYSI